MGKGRDLTSTERAFVHSKIKQFWDYEKKQIKHGKIFEIRKLSAQSGVPCSDRTVKRLAGEMKLQEQKNDEVFAETGQVGGLDFTHNKKGKCGRPSKLTEEVKEAYRSLQTLLTLISTTLASFLRSNITSVRFALIVQAVKK
jgi:hypothetical protein